MGDLRYSYGLQAPSYYWPQVWSQCFDYRRYQSPMVCLCHARLFHAIRQELVKEVAKERADKTKNLVVVYFSMRATDRLQNFFQAAQTDRALVINLMQDICLSSQGVWNCNLERKRYYLLSDLSGSLVIRCRFRDAS